MKKSLIILAFIITIGGGGAFVSTANTYHENDPAPTNTEQKTVTLSVPGMHCSACPFKVRKSLEKLDGVINIQTSLESKTVTVTYDPSKVTVNDLTQVTKDAGYPSTIQK